jgi:hypothetical protein
MSTMQGRSGWMTGLLLSAVLALTGMASAHAGAPKPVIERAVKGEQCVEDTDYMRRNHMKVLNHHRDKTVLQGIRTPQHSLKGCIDCHHSPKTGSVAAQPENFCASCHAYAAVKIDCFDCHSTKPGVAPPANPQPSGALHDRPKLASRANTGFGVHDLAGAPR